MRAHIIAVLALSAFFTAPAAAATKIDDPVKFVSSVYAKIADASKVKDNDIPDDIYTPRLAALFAIEKKDSGGEVGRLDFEFWTSAQDWELSDIKVTGSDVEGAKDRKIVVAKFKNIDRRDEIHFYFEKTKAGWQLDDVRSAGKSDQWVLSLILKYGWDDNSGQ